ncbi:MAG: ATP-dependent RecD-like DNA helicase [Dethiobacter sp.]|nr:ATP-dependent RecD-like DNA helicase [Dethiobacter sp.]
MPKLEGVLERVTYYNDATFFMVARLRACDETLHTIIGNLPRFSVGEQLLLDGEWSEHPEYGRQFKATAYESAAPQNVKGILRFLSSGQVKGVGPATAEKIVHAFGAQALDVLEKEPARLTALEGIGEKRATMIAASLRERREIMRVMSFLQGFGVGPGYAARIYRKYGEATKDIVSKNPYQLAEDVFGVGFRTADKIALEMGFAPASSHRLRAALLYLLNQAQDEGHVFLPVEELFSRVWEALDLEEDSEWAELMEKQLKRLAQDGLLVLEGLPGGTAAYLAPLYHAERYAAHKLRELARYSFSEAPDPLASEEAIAGLSEGQRQAVLQALSHGLLVITGGPGTGKTTTTKSLLALFARQGLEVLLAAPTGRAAKRMTEATGREAKTIHRLLEYAYSEGEGYRFQRDEARPLRAHVLIVDEVSMVDVLLFCQLLKAIPAGCRLILVGDADQLPSVGPGNVLREIIASGSVPVARLEQIFRQAERSAIVTNAHLVNAGQLPQWEGSSGEFCFISQSEPEQILEQILDLCSRRLPRYRNKDAINDIQVLSPMRRTVLGVENLNLHLQQRLNPPAPHKTELRVGQTIFRLGDKVMQIRNNYQKEVFNGDIGSITYLNLEDGELTVCYPDVSGLREVLYDLAELEELVLSYAVSVHKSQGSEYPVVILPVVTQHYVLLQRNLLYTAITRAKELVVLVGTRKALAIAVRNNKVETRYTRLAARLNG